MLSVGSKISVRKIAREMDVCEGTAYRAIKDAENLGYVSTIERVGTVRIDKKYRNNIGKLTYAELVNLVEGHVLAGDKGLHKTLDKFLIATMELEELKRRIETGDLLIVGNRYDTHRLSIIHGTAILITDGLSTSDEIKSLANQSNLPIISTNLNTYKSANIINRALYDCSIKKDIMMIDDIMIDLEDVSYLFDTQTIIEWQRLVETSYHSRFPVVDETRKLVGIVTYKDVVGKEKTMTMDKVMTKNPISLLLKTSIVSAAHIMIREGIKLVPVIDSSRKLVGVINRQDVFKALYYIQRQPQGDKSNNSILRNFEEYKEEDVMIIKGVVNPQMTNQFGILANGPLITLLTETANRVLRQYKKGDLVTESITVHFIKPVQIEHFIEVKAKAIDVSRRFGKIDVEVHNKNQIVCKALLTMQVIER